MGNSLLYRLRANVIVVHPTGRFTTKTPEQWRDASYWTLLAYCNHDVDCLTTFTDAQHLNGMCLEDLQEIILSFIMALAEGGRTMGITACPLHVRKNWLLGVARRERLQERKHSVATVTEAL